MRFISVVEKVQEILARNMRLARQRKGVSQEALADLASVDRTYVSGIERQVRNPTITVVAKLAAALDCTTSDLLRDESQAANAG
jgi:transcriptional regulator with XRE-family HTH domain